jgi:hypothetical protein
MSEKKRKMFGFPWPQSHIEAFHICAAELQSGRAKGNASELARTILEQSMFSYLGTERARKLGILNPWDKTAPDPRILEFLLEIWSKRENSARVGSSVSRAARNQG